MHLTLERKAYIEHYAQRGSRVGKVNGMGHFRAI
jgi:hypothetical protein